MRWCRTEVEPLKLEAAARSLQIRGFGATKLLAKVSRFVPGLHGTVLVRAVLGVESSSRRPGVLRRRSPVHHCFLERAVRGLGCLFQALPTRRG